MQVSDYAVIEVGDTVVANVIVADEKLELQEYYLVKINQGVFVTLVMYYNASTDTFD